MTAGLFPYDPIHQTFVNFYEKDAITAQVILERRTARSSSTSPAAGKGSPPLPAASSRTVSGTF